MPIQRGRVVSIRHVSQFDGNVKNRRLDHLRLLRFMSRPAWLDLALFPLLLGEYPLGEGCASEHRISLDP